MGARFKITDLLKQAASSFGILFFFLLAFHVTSGAESVNKDAAGVALKGYDVVAYFTEGKAVMGKKALQREWMGATWQFSSATHRDLFADNPSKYAPQYGGYCALEVSEGHKAPVDPKVWKIIDGKLYLNYDADVGKEWRKDIPGRIAKADKNWPKIANENQ